MSGWYGSYTSLSTMSAPLDTSFNKIRSHDSSCAFPSWPRRSSLSMSEDCESYATSYLSDDDLFLSDPSDDENRSVSSTSSSISPATDVTNWPPRPTEQEFLQREWERRARQREYMRQAKMDAERRRQSAMRARKSSPNKSSSSSSSSSSSTTTSGSGSGSSTSTTKPAALATITECGE